MKLGDRMKYYERVPENVLMKKVPVILRLDGRAFHTVTRGFKKPFDNDLIDVMKATAELLMNSIQGARMSYTQSDEITLVLWDGQTMETDAYFGYRQFKLNSIPAAIASVEVSKRLGVDVQFDCRSFNLPLNEILNCILWRYKDWTRNSIQMVARNNFSHRELHKKSTSDIHEMLHRVNVNWATDYSGVEKNGTLLYKEESEERNEIKVIHEELNYDKLIEITKKSITSNYLKIDL